MEHKVRILAFLELLFNCGKDERCLSFTQISQTCFVEVEQVEMLVMKAMSLELVKGAIDEVDQTVQIDWIMPRYLSTDHLKLLAERMSEWEDKVGNIVRMVEDNAHEVLHN